MTAIYALIGLYLVAIFGYAGRRFAQKRASDITVPILLFFGLWNSVVAVAVSLAANRLLHFVAAREGAISTLSIISLSPLVLVLGGNVAICVGAYRSGLDRDLVFLLSSWIIASLLTITALGAISPFTVIVNLFFP